MNPLKLRKHKKKGALHKAFTLLVVPVAIILGITVTWWVNDQFWLYAQMFVIGNEVAANNGQSANAFNGSKAGINSVGKDDGSSQGPAGLNLALMNKMSAGYCKDYLDIMNKHADWTYMNEATKLSDDPIPLITLLGMSGTETGTNKVTLNGQTLQVPGSAIRYEEYNTVSGLNFYQATSAWFAQNGLHWIDVPTKGDAGWMQWGDPSTDNGGKAHTTVLQFDKGWFSIYPAGRYDGGAKSYPSLMKTGYGIDSNAERTSADLDAAYFPDMVSVQIQSAPGRLVKYADVDSLKDFTTALSAMHVGHHGDLSVIDIGTGAYVGSNLVWLLSDNSPHTTKEAVSGSLNMYSDMMNDIYDYLALHIDTADIKFGSDYDAFGIGLGYMFYKYDAFFVTEAERQKCIRLFQNTNWPGFEVNRGMKLGFEIASGRSWTDAEVVTFLQGSSRVKSLPAGYPSNLLGRYHHALDTYWFYIYVQDPVIDVIYNSGNGTVVPALHAWHKTTLGAAMRDPLKGAYVYWDMLRVSGVDCTIGEVLGNNGNTDLIDQIPTFSDGLQSSSVSELMAYYAVMYSWPTREQGLASWGTALYRRVHYDITKIIGYGETYPRSCDRGTMMATYWAGATSWRYVTFGGCGGIQKNLESEKNFARVKSFKYTLDTIDQLRPGDIIICDSHIMMYVGKEIVHEIYPDAKPEFDLVHASISDGNCPNQGATSKKSGARSPNLDSIASIIKYDHRDFVAYRCTYAKPNDKLTNILTQEEIAWLFANPGYGVHLCTFSNGTSGRATNRESITIPYMPGG